MEDTDRINIDFLKENMNIVLSERKKLHMNDDYGIEKCWSKMTELLSKG